MYMKIPVWNVYVEDFNGEIASYNIFNHGGFWESVKKDFKKYRDDFDGFSAKVQRELMYYFWAKCEWEVIISEWPPRTKGVNHQKKVDVHDQVLLNYEKFIQYLWDYMHAHSRKRTK